MRTPPARFFLYFLPSAAALAGLTALFHALSLGQERALHEARACRGVELYAAAVASGRPEPLAAGLPGELLLVGGDGGVLSGPPGRSFAREQPAAWPLVSGTPHGSAVLPEGFFHFSALGRGTAPPHVVYFAAPAQLYAASRERLGILLALAVPVLAGLAGLIWGLCRAQDNRAAQERLCRASEVRLRALAAGLIETQERERTALSRELHDDLGQLLSVMCLELERSLSPDGAVSRPEVVRRALDGAERALDRVRMLSGRLRPQVLDDLGLKEAARSLVAQYRGKTGIDLESELSLDSRSVPPLVGENIYRILQEAVTNVARHAKAERGRVTLRQSKDGLELVVQDWGVGFTPPPSGAPALGLLSMRERAELLGGTFTLVSEPGRGTEVRVRVPTRAASEGPARP